jgi:hypothetical protein
MPVRMSSSALRPATNDVKTIARSRPGQSVCARILVAIECGDQFCNGLRRYSFSEGISAFSGTRSLELPPVLGTDLGTKRCETSPNGCDMAEAMGHLTATDLQV